MGPVILNRTTSIRQEVSTCGVYWVLLSGMGEAQTSKLCLGSQKFYCTDE
jgi:hypothetical protein